MIQHQGSRMGNLFICQRCSDIGDKESSLNWLSRSLAKTELSKDGHGNPKLTLSHKEG